jgi:hypothetical protein
MDKRVIYMNVIIPVAGLSMHLRPYAARLLGSQIRIPFGDKINARVLCWTVQAEALRWADLPSNESYQMSNGFTVTSIKYEPEYLKRPNTWQL